MKFISFESFYGHRTHGYIASVNVVKQEQMVILFFLKKMALLDKYFKLDFESFFY